MSKTVTVTVKNPTADFTFSRAFSSDRLICISVSVPKGRSRNHKMELFVEYGSERDFECAYEACHSYGLTKEQFTRAIQTYQAMQGNSDRKVSSQWERLPYDFHVIPCKQ